MSGKEKGGRGKEDDVGVGGEMKTERRKGREGSILTDPARGSVCCPWTSPTVSPYLNVQ